MAGENSKKSKIDFIMIINALLKRKEILSSRVDQCELELNIANERLSKINKEIAEEYKRKQKILIKKYGG